MIVKTFLDKFATISCGSKMNSGLNQVAELHYGDGVYSRILIHFDHTKLKNMVEDKTFGDVSKLKHTLNITNSGSIDFKDLHCSCISEISGRKIQRASSFDLIFFLIPMEWDNGKGFDMAMGKKSLNMNDSKFKSTDGCNWFKPKNGDEWLEEGVYSTDTLSKAYTDFGNGEESIVFARQHFDIGNENIKLDITDIVNKYINEELDNYGIGIAFTPLTEIQDPIYEAYCPFYTNKTNTFFEPYVETEYDECITDDRSSFTLNKTNKLYLYCNIGGQCQNLDEMPVCKIDDAEYEVKQATKGVYYAEVYGDKEKFNSNMMYYDVWSNIKYNGEELDDIEMDFVVNKANKFFNIGNSMQESVKVTPIIYGIDENEHIYRNGDIRKVNVICKKNYENNKVEHPSKMCYRLYVMDGTREYIVQKDKLNIGMNEAYFNLFCDDLLPNKYYIDIIVEYNKERITYKNILKFHIVDNINNKIN